MRAAVRQHSTPTCPQVNGSKLVALLLAVVVLARTSVDAANLYVPTGFATIQSAIDAAGPGDIIHLAAGRYNEVLTITNSLTIIGSGTNDCVLYCLTNVPIVSLTGPANCVFSNFEIEGG